MKKQWMTLSAALLAVMMVAAVAMAQPGMGQQGPRPTMVQSGTYTNDAAGYTVKVPEGWTGMAQGKVITAMHGTPQQIQASGGMVQAFLISADSARAQKDVDLAGMTEKELRGWFLEQSQMSEEQLDGLGKTSLAGETAIRVEFTQPAIPGRVPAERKGIGFFMMKDGMAYNLMYMAPTAEFEAIRSFAENHMDTFTVQ